MRHSMQKIKESRIRQSGVESEIYASKSSMRCECAHDNPKWRNIYSKLCESNPMCILDQIVRNPSKRRMTKIDRRNGVKYPIGNHEWQ